MTKDGEAGNTAQHVRFLEAARELGCDEDEDAFDKKLKAVVGPKATENCRQGETGASKP